MRGTDVRRPFQLRRRKAGFRSVSRPVREIRSELSGQFESMYSDNVARFRRTGICCRLYSMQ